MQAIPLMFCDCCDAVLTADELLANPRHQQDLCHECAAAYDEANPGLVP